MSLHPLFSFVMGRRGERGIPLAARRLPPVLLAMVARRRRSQGFYDGRTRAVFRRVWQQTHSIAALVEYALYRRDLGYPLPPRWIAPLVTGLYRLRPASRRLALALLAESSPQTLSTLPLHYLVGGGNILAPLASFLVQRGESAAPRWLARLHERQLVWREDFSSLLRARAKDGICLVGNAGSLRGGGLGSHIDGQGLVVRFNRYSGPNSAAVDFGSKMEVWVGAPGFSGQPPADVSWVISTGPDMRFRRQNWASFEERLTRDLPVLTVPLSVWRELVAQCCAPPSAGLLLLAWMRELLGSWGGISTVGIGIPPSANTPYHHAVPKQLPYDRHDWEKERALLRRWRSEGLRSQEFPQGSGEKE